MKNLFEQALAISKPWYIKSLDFDIDKKQLDIYIDFKKGHKFFYEDNNNDKNGHYPVHDTKEKTWRHLNFFQHECYLHCRTPRVKTNDNKTKLVSPPWEGKSTGFTLLFEAFILQMCKFMPVSNVSEITSVSASS